MSKQKRRKSKEQRDREEKLRRYRDKFEKADVDDDEDTDESFYTQAQLEAVYDLLSDFPELDDFDGILDMDEGDFYTNE